MDPRLKSAKNLGEIRPDGFRLPSGEHAGMTRLLQLIPIAALLIAAYYPGFVWMADRWGARDSYYGHGFLIPLVTLYWLFKKRHTLAALPAEFGAFGLVFLLLGGAAHIVSSALRIYFLSGFSFVLILLGIAGVMYGRKIFSQVWFPLSFLALAVPMPLLVISQTTLKMKFFVSEMAAKLLTLSHIPSYREGSYLFTPHSFLLVGDPCSGLRSFLAFICLGFVFAYEGKMPLWKRLVLVVSGLPLAILSNVVRVYALGMIAEIYGMKSIEGAVHDASGVVVFIMAFLIFMGIKNQLEKNENVILIRHDSLAEKDLMNRSFRRTSPAIYFGLVAFCAALHFFPLAMPHAFHVDETKNPIFQSFPYDLGGWKGEDVPVDEKTYEILETRNVLSRLYKNAEGVQMHVLLVGSHKDRRVAHPPEVCYLSSNYIILDEKEKSISIKDQPIAVKSFLARHERHPDRQELVIYLYKVGERFTTSYYSQQLQFAVDRLAQRDSEVLLIRLAIPSQSEAVLQRSESSFQDFLSLLLTKI